MILPGKSVKDSWTVVLPPLNLEALVVIGLAGFLRFAPPDVLILVASLVGVLVANINPNDSTKEVRNGKIDSKWLLLLALFVTVLGYYVIAQVLPLYAAVSIAFAITEGITLLLITIALRRYQHRHPERK